MNETAKHIGPALSSLLIIVTLAWLAGSAKAKAKSENGTTWLEYSFQMKALTSLFIVLLAIFIGAIIRTPSRDAAVAGLVATGLVGYLALEAFFVKIGYNDEKIFAYSPWRSPRIVTWSDVSSFEFSSSMQWWSISTRSSGTIRAHLYLKGLDDFAVELKKRKRNTA